MICNSCNLKEVSSPKLTGELCAACYFENKRKTDINYRFKTMGDSFPVKQVIEEESTTEIALEENPISLAAEGRLNKIEPIKVEQVPEKGKKYCQSCIDRGYGLVLASREWNPGYFICDDCFKPLLENIINPNSTELGLDNSSKVKNLIKQDKALDSGPFLTQFYDILEIPPQLRFNNPESVLNSRNDIFTFHSEPLVNQSLPEIIKKMEELQVMLFQIKLKIEPIQSYISKVKDLERSKANLTSIKDGVKIEGKSKVKSSQDQKMADTLFKNTISDPKKRLEKYLEMVKLTRETEFKKLTGTD